MITLALLGAVLGAEPPALEGLVEGNSRFAYAFYTHVPKPEENLVVSPYGISECFAMVYAGARGATAEAMASSFHFGEDPEALLVPFGALHDAMNTASHGEGSTLWVADSLWTSASCPVRAAYSDMIAEQLGGEVFKVNFADVSKVTSKMDAWVNRETSGLIPKAPGKVTPQDVVSLMNVVYFKADWANRFKTQATRKQPFTLIDGSTADVDTMHQTGQFKYAKLDGFEVLELPYRTGRISMVLLLPEKGASLAALEKTLTQERVERWLAALSTKETAVALPRFSLKSSLDLSRILQDMGLRGVFGGGDFSGMFASGSPGITEAVQNAVIQVDETGTEAAAVTKVTLGRSLRRPAASFRADRPFMFLIRDNELGSLYFMGRVTDPRAPASS